MSDLTVDSQGHVAILQIRRPPANYFDAELLDQIADCAQALQGDGQTRALVLCSEGKHFCAGADFGSTGLSGPEQRSEAAGRIYRAGIRLFEIELPIIAAVQGSAVGGGLGLACAADFRIAGPESRFHANFAGLGFHHGFGLTVTLPRIVGEQRALDLLLNARRIDGVRAAEIGLVDQLSATGAEIATAVDFARHLTTLAPLAVRAIKRTIKSSVPEEVRLTLEHELAEQRRLWASEDSRIGIQASLHRITPLFVGR